MKPTCFYQPDGEADCFRATAWTRGPWSFEHQHGGPPAALLARAVEKARSEPELAVLRFTVEFLRPVPIGPVRVGVESLKRGRTVECHTARLWSGKTLLLAATALCLRRRTPAAAGSTCVAAGPETAQPYVFSFFPDPVGYQAAVDVRYVSGSWGRPSVTCWLRQRCPLLREKSRRHCNVPWLPPMQAMGSRFRSIRNPTCSLPRTCPFISRDLYGAIGLVWSRRARPTLRALDCVRHGYGTLTGRLATDSRV